MAWTSSTRIGARRAHNRLCSTMDGHFHRTTGMHRCSSSIRMDIVSLRTIGVATDAPHRWIGATTWITTQRMPRPWLRLSTFATRSTSVIRPAEARWRATSQGMGNHKDAFPARKRVVEGKSVSVRVDLGGCRIIKKKKQNKKDET